MCLTDSGGRDSGAAAPGVELPPQIQVDLNLRKAEQAVRSGDAATAREAMERVASLEREHGLAPSPEDHYRYAQAWASAGEPQRAMAAAVRYLRLVGREAEHYTEALDLINREGLLETVPASGNAASSRVGPGAPAGTPRVAVAQPQPGESRVFDGIQFVWVPAGEFLMGSESEEADDDEQPLTRVRISQGFFLGKYEVTQAEWQAVMGGNPSEFDECGPDCPVENVSWEDVQEFIGKLNAAVGDERYRLPTEAEWEYAARAGTSGDTPAGDLDILGRQNAPLLDGIAWYGGNSGVNYEGGYDCSDWKEKQYASSRCGTHPVGQKAPNAWGLHDMLGNASEWVEDWYGDYPGGEVTDPRGPVSGSLRVLRGGSWGFYARYCRAAYRGYNSPGARSNFLGFRLLRTE